MRINLFKNIKKWAGRLLLGTALVAGLASCNTGFSEDSSSTSAGEKEQKAYVSVKCGVSSRTFLPTDISEEDITKVELLGRKNAPNSDIELIQEWVSTESDNAVSVMKNSDKFCMEPGTYTFLLALYVTRNSNYMLCQSGSIEGKTIKAGNNTLSFQTKYVANGSGSVAISLKWNKPDYKISAIKADFYPVYGLNVSKTSAKTDYIYGEKTVTRAVPTPAMGKELKPDSDYETISKTIDDIPQGNYNLVLSVYDDCDEKIDELPYTVVVKTECVTYVSIGILEDLNAKYSLSFVIHRLAEWTDGEIKIRENADNKIILPSDEDISFDGYMLSGWSTEEDGSGENFEPGDSAFISKDTTLYAQWKKGWRLTFINGDEVISYKVPADEEYTMQEIPVDEGYTFMGWIDENGLTYYPASYSISEDLVLRPIIFEGKGTEDSPYLLKTIQDWNNFASLVADLYDFEKEYVSLACDIGSEKEPVTQMVPAYRPVSTSGVALGKTRKKYFSGTFNGDGHAITVNYDSDAEYVAPFAYTGKGAEFKNLTVKGSIKGSSTGAGGLIGFPYESVTVTNCTVSAEITGADERTAIAGFISYTPNCKYGSDYVLTMTACVFDGKFKGSERQDAAGFLFVNSYYGDFNFKNCLFDSSKDVGGLYNFKTFTNAQSHNDEGLYSTIAPNSSGSNFGESYENLTVVHKTLEGLNSIAKPVEVLGRNYYKLCEITYPTEIDYDGGNPVIFANGVYDPVYDENGTLQKIELQQGKNYEISFKDAKGNTVDAISDGEYTVTFTGKGNYTGTCTNKVYVTKPLSGKGTETEPYKISSMADWIYFCNSVENGNDYQNKYVELTEDLGTEENPVTATVGGSSYTSAFFGSFDGKGHKITVDYDFTDAAWDETWGTFNAIGYYDDASSTLAEGQMIPAVKNLTIAGKILTDGRTGALAGTAQFAKISDCAVTAEIKTSSQGCVSIGGFIGYLNVYSNKSFAIDFEGCYFGGKLLGIDGAEGKVGYSSGFVGFSDKPDVDVTFEGCVFAPEEFTFNEKICSSFIHSNSEIRFNSDDNTNRTTLALAGKNTGRYPPYQGLLAYRTVEDAAGKDIVKPVSILGYTYYDTVMLSFENEAPELSYGDYTLVRNKDYTWTVRCLDDNTVVDSYNDCVDGKKYEEVFTGIGNYAGSVSYEWEEGAGANLSFVEYFLSGLKGKGTETDPYIIENDDNFYSFAYITSAIQDGDPNHTSFKGIYFSLGSDVELKTPVAENGCFEGIFDGNGHWLSCDLKNGSADYYAPFCRVKNAVIKNLRVSGTVSSSANGASGLVGYVEEGVTIQNCFVEVYIYNSNSNNAALGNAGFIAFADGTGEVVLENCAFRGGLSGKMAFTSGFVSSVYCDIETYLNGGYIDNNDIIYPVLTNCLYDPSYIDSNILNSSSGNASFGMIDLEKSSNLLYRDENYLLDSDDYGYASKVESYKPDSSESYIEYSFIDGYKYYQETSLKILFSQEMQNENQTFIVKDKSESIVPEFAVIDFMTVKPLSEENYDAVITNSKGKKVTSCPAGSYTITVTLKGKYHGTIVRNFDVHYQLEGEGSEENPYLIRDAIDWEIFADNVSAGYSYENEYVLLENNLGTKTNPITKMAGILNNYMGHFDGTFNGGYHTIYVNYVADDSQSQGTFPHIAPFGVIKDNAVIKNLTVAGSIVNNAVKSGYPAGIAALAVGDEKAGKNPTIENCRVSASISSGKYGDSCAGGYGMAGFVNRVEGSTKITFKNCVFDGSLSGALGQNGGFVAVQQKISEVDLENCVFDPESIQLDLQKSYTFTSEISENSTCYYTDPLGTAQGKQVYKDMPDDGKNYAKITLYDGSTYFVEARYPVF